MPALGLRLPRRGPSPETLRGIAGFERREESNAQDGKDNSPKDSQGKKSRKKEQSNDKDSPNSSSGQDQATGDRSTQADSKLNPLPLPPLSTPTTSVDPDGAPPISISFSSSVSTFATGTADTTPDFTTSASDSQTTLPTGTPVGQPTKPSIALCEPGEELCLTPTPTLNSAATNGSAKISPSMVGPLVGGLIGSAVFIGIIAIGALLYLRRRRRTHIAPSAQYMSTNGGAASFRPLPSQYSGSSRSTTPSLGTRGGSLMDLQPSREGILP